MADTVITPSDTSASAAGWAVAIIVLLGVILFAMFVWPGVARTPSGSASTPNTIDVNVRLPQGQGEGNTNPSNTQQQTAPTQ